MEQRQKEKDDPKAGQEKSRRRRRKRKRWKRKTERTSIFLHYISSETREEEKGYHSLREFSVGFLFALCLITERMKEKERNDKTNKKKGHKFGCRTEVLLFSWKEREVGRERIGSWGKITPVS